MRILDGVTKCQLASAQMIALAGQFVTINGEIGTLSTDDDELLFSDVLAGVVVLAAEAP